MKFRTVKVGLLLVSTALALVAASAARTVAHAGDTTPTCGIMTQSYGVTSTGGLVEYDYCLSSPMLGKQSSHKVAPDGWWQGGAVFSGGVATGSPAHPSVFYQVARDGSLLWSSDDGGTMGPSRRIGVAALTDWRQYRVLFAVGSNICAVDAAGRLLCWKHLGHDDGSDVMSGPDVLGRGFTAGQRVVHRDGIGWIGTDQSQPGAVIHWSSDGVVVGRPEPVTGPVDVQTATFARGFDIEVGYARAGDGRIALLTMTESGTGWTATPLVTGRFGVVFAGSIRQQMEGFPYEWQ